MRAAAAGIACVLAACGSDGAGHHADAPPAPDAPPDIPPDARITGGAMLVVKSPPGPTNGDMATWEGALAYKIAEDGAAEVAITGIDKSALHDPSAALFRVASSEVLIGNRHGNNAADGTAGSISRFSYDPMTQVFTGNGEILGNGLAGVHQIALNPVTGEMFAANVATGVSRFTFAADGSAVAHGTISDGLTRGVAVSPDGARLYVSTASNVIRQFDLATGTEATAVSLGTTANLHYFAIRGSELYVAALDDLKVYRFTIGPGDELTFSQAIDAPSPIAVAFSESGNEMFVTGHRTGDLVSRYSYVASTNAWMPTTEITGLGSLGGLAMLPIR